MRQTSGIRGSVMAVLIACGAAAMIPASPAEAGNRSRYDCKPSRSHHSSYSYRHRSNSRVGFSVHIGTGGYSKYRSSYGYGYSNDCSPRYSYGYAYSRPSYAYCPPTYRYEYYDDRPRVNTYYNNYSYNTYSYPTAPAGASTYRVWQQEMEAPATAPAPVYPSYNPGPAQPSPAPVAQMEQGSLWTTVDLRPRQIEQGVTKADRPRTSIFDDSAPARAGATPDQAWESMRDGDYTSARSAFASLTQTMPDSSEMKLGFGLANALDGRDSAAAWSIRRALGSGVGIESVREKFAGMEQALEALATRLAERVEDTGGGDGWIVLSVVQSIRGESDAAGFAALQAIEAGDRSDAMTHLAGQLGIEIPAE